MRRKPPLVLAPAGPLSQILCPGTLLCPMAYWGWQISQGLVRPQILLDTTSSSALPHLVYSGPRSWTLLSNGIRLEYGGASQFPFLEWRQWLMPSDGPLELWQEYALLNHHPSCGGSYSWRSGSFLAQAVLQLHMSGLACYMSCLELWPLFPPKWPAHQGENQAAYAISTLLCITPSTTL